MCIMNKIKKTTAIIIAAAILFCSFAFSSSAANVKNYLLLGDSIAYGAGLINSQDACYGKIVADTNNYNYENYAVNGYTSAAVLKHIDVDFVREGVKRADIISISVGGNDFLTANLIALLIEGELGIDRRFDEIEEKFAENFAAIIAKIRGLNSHATILVQTLYNPSKFLFTDIYQKGVNVINGVIRGYQSANPGVIDIVEIESAFAGHAIEYIAFDTIHPNSKGNLVIAKAVLQKLYALGLGSTTEPVINYPGIDTVGISRDSILGILTYFARLFSKYSDIMFS